MSDDKSITISSISEINEYNIQKEGIKDIKDEIKEESRELKPRVEGEVLIGPKRLTRFEKARIVGARALQLSLGAPPLVKVTPDIKDSIRLAEYELNCRALPITIRRVLPDGKYQNIPLSWLMD